MRELPYQVFVYGSLKQGEYNNDCITQHGGVFLSTAKTIGTYLLFGGVFPKLAAYHDMSKAQARQHKSYKGHVAGELWRVSATTLPARDDRGDDVRRHTPAVGLLHRASAVRLVSAAGA